MIADKYKGVEKSGEQWAEHFKDIIMDIDGWRKDDHVDFRMTTVSYEEYHQRLSECTIKFSDSITERFKEKNSK